MHRPSALFAGFLVAAAFMLATPVSAQAAFSPWISFGGRVVTINYCLHGAVNVVIIPAGLFPISYVWSMPPTTITATPPYVPPLRIGQQVIGLALVPSLVPCVGPGVNPPVWWGLKVIYGGVSSIL